MIQENIKESYPHHLTKSTCTDQHIFIADYTHRTKFTTPKRGTEFFMGNPPLDIEYFSLHNKNSLKTFGIPFDHKSFKRFDGNIDSQCECVIFPKNSDSNSWICFIELKYNDEEDYNQTTINKARKQLFKTQYHYKRMGIFCKTNTCYLFASLIVQAEPFPNTALPPSYLIDMKEKHNIVIRFINSAEIIDNRQINA